ncbi:MAG: metallophosphoesterase [Crocinitomix sp.]|nr:metallophosphoesterase [Crocinitomix sp.]
MAKLTLQYCSDLHLEFPKNQAYIQTNPIIPKGEILLLAGDIIPFQMMEHVDWFFDQIQTQFKAVYWIAGNHEYYGSDISLRSGTFHEKIRENIHLVNNYRLNLEECSILFTTLWSEISPQNVMQIKRGMSDYYHIKNGPYTFNPDDSSQLFRENVAFLETELKEMAQIENQIIVTHHVPTFENYPSKFKNSPLNNAFATELAPLILDHSISHWIYGHSHCNVPDFKIGNTILTNNQLGYVDQFEHLDYRKTATIEL